MRFPLCGCALVLAVTPAFAGGVVVDTVLIDNGDGDGIADTRETVQMALTVHNSTGIALTGVTARLISGDPQLVCITQPVVSIGDLAPGEVRQVAEPFAFTVLDVDRTALGLGPLDNLSAEFQIAIDSEPQAAPALPRKIALDLDLDVSGGSGPTSFFESFEPGTLGAFEIENLDQNLNDLAAGDGYRCQYNDPDWHNSNGQGSNQAAVCYPGASLAQADAVFWGLSGPAFSPEGGRGFSGFHSLFFGIDFGPPLGWTTPLAVLEAVRTSQPINIGWDGVSPTLTFKHQASLVDDDLINTFENSVDRGVVLAQLANDSGVPFGEWFKLEPYANAYDQQAMSGFYNCMFDPIDDGSTEDDFFVPSDPLRRLGPSSTCYPEYAFTRIGETSHPFDAAHVGEADGPGLQGQWGIGTWIESKFDLRRFEGRRLRLRFLATTIKDLNFPDWQNKYVWNPVAGDDGWWIDDVTVTGALVTPATVTVDIHDNSSLPGLPPDSDDDLDVVCDWMDNCPGVQTQNLYDADNDGAGDACDPCPSEPGAPGPDHDGDGLCVDNCPYVANPYQSNDDADGAGNECDCKPNDGSTYPGAPERNDGKDNQCPGDPGYGVVDELSQIIYFQNRTTLAWPPQVGATRYQAVRAKKVSFSMGCAQWVTTGTSAVDTAAPLEGEAYFYLVRPRDPHVGSWGQDSSGEEQSGLCLPL